MAAYEVFRAHVYGADLATPCSESDAVKMIIEMLLGSSNDMFGHVLKPVDKLYCIPESNNQNNISIQVFHVTPFGLHTRLENISSTLLHGILKWFGQLGSQLYICRKFALYSRNSTESTNQQNQLTSAVLDTLRSSISSLLSSVEEALCDFEHKVLELPLSEGKAKLHTRLEYNRRITLIALYQRCLPWQSMFHSLAGIVCSTMPVSALPSLTPAPPQPTFPEQTPSKHQIPAYHANAYTPPASPVDAVFEKLTVRGILQDVGEMLALGGLVDIHPSMRLLADGMNSSRNKSGYIATEMKEYSECTEHKEHTESHSYRGVSLIRPSHHTIEVNLTLQLPTLYRSGYYLYAKLFFSAMLEKYLTNLVSMVWQQQKPLTNTATKDSDTVYSVHNTTSYSVYDTPVARRSLNSVVNTPDESNKTHRNNPESAIKTIFSTPMSNKTLLAQDVGAIDGVLQMLTVFGMSSHKNRKISNNSAGVSTLAARRKQRRVVSLLQQTRDLIIQNNQYEVPSFLLPITQEAMVSARDILILQKSHIQRQNPSYNLSRLKKLIQDSMQEFSRALLPYHYSLDNNNITSPTVNISGNKSTSHLAATLPLLSRDELNDPVVSYLLTGRSVKIVGVRTPITTGGTDDTSRGVNDTHLCIATSATAAAAASSSVHSDTVDSYYGGGVTGNVDYLGPLLAQRAAQLSIAKELATSVTVTKAGNVVDKVNDTTNLGHHAVQKYRQKRAPELVPLSELLCYTTATTTVQVSLLHRLKEQLHTARADAALYVLKSFQLQDNLRYVRDVFLLGQPDFYAPIRELCLNLTDWKSRLSDSRDKNTRLKQSNSVYNRMSSMFIGEAITGGMMDKAPTCGVRYLSVQVKSSHRASTNDADSSSNNNVASVGMGSATPTMKKSSSAVVPLQALLSSYLSTMTSSSTLFTNTHSATTADSSDNDVIELFATITNLHIQLLHEWPLTSFVDASLYPALNNNMRFLLLLTASRWAAEYWWMDAISNHSLNTTAYTNTGLNAHTNTNTSGDTSYLGDVLQAKRNCRAGLAVFLHTITAVNNIFMAHIHRTLWPAFEAALESHQTSLPSMQYELHSVFQLIDASLTLLRDQVLSIVVKGFSASCAMRAAISLEYTEIAPIEAQNKAFQALHSQQRLNTHKASLKHKKNEPKLRNPRVEMKNTLSTTDTEECPKVRYVTSAAVLVAYRAAEDAYADLKYAVSDLKNTVVQEVRRNARTGAVGRECKAMEELLMYLST